MIVFIAILLTTLTFGFIAYPLLKQMLRLPADSVKDETLQELSSKRDTTYSMLKELEFDFQSGILTEDDFQDLEKRYKRKAVSILKDIDDLKTSNDAEDEIEKQVLDMRRVKGHFCPKCGAEHKEDDRFCSHCGTSLKK